MKIRWLLFLIILLACIIWVCKLLFWQFQTEDISLEHRPSTRSEPSSYSTLLAKARANRNVRVIVELRLPVQFKPEGELSPQAVQAQREAINLTRQQLLTGLTSHRVTIISGSDQWIIPRIALKVDASALMYLAQSPQVKNISEDVPDGL